MILFVWYQNNHYICPTIKNNNIMTDTILKIVKEYEEKHQLQKQEVIKWLSEVGTIDVVQEVVEQVIKNREESKIDEE
jgi:hypothetical protein